MYSFYFVNDSRVMCFNLWNDPVSVLCCRKCVFRFDLVNFKTTHDRSLRSHFFARTYIYINIVISLLLSIKLIPLLIHYVIVSVIVMRGLILWFKWLISVTKTYLWSNIKFIIGQLLNFNVCSVGLLIIPPTTRGLIQTVL